MSKSHNNSIKVHILCRHICGPLSTALTSFIPVEFSRNKFRKQPINWPPESGGRRPQGKKRTIMSVIVSDINQLSYVYINYVTNSRTSARSPYWHVFKRATDTKSRSHDTHSFNHAAAGLLIDFNFFFVFVQPDTILIIRTANCHQVRAAVFRVIGIIHSEVRTALPGYIVDLVGTPEWLRINRTHAVRYLTACVWPIFHAPMNSFRMP